VLTVESPALPGREFSARVKFIGAAVSAANRTLPLVCELDNPERLFKPGMFVWVTVPPAKPRTVLAVSPASLLHHDGKAFVFVAEGPETFRRVDVEVGAETTRWVEITAGLTAGQAVVDAGAFYLKSELLLEREVE
jgi:multidrug efflux pump subunit AcrA (membrane-fusion protein)